jgi:hypothetical protein
MLDLRRPVYFHGVLVEICIIGIHGEQLLIEHQKKR